MSIDGIMWLLMRKMDKKAYYDDFTPAIVCIVAIFIISMMAIVLIILDDDDAYICPHCNWIGNKDAMNQTVEINNITSYTWNITTSQTNTIIHYSCYRCGEPFNEVTWTEYDD